MRLKNSHNHAIKASGLTIELTLVLDKSASYAKAFSKELNEKLKSVATASDANVNVNFLVENMADSVHGQYIQLDD